MFDVKGFFFIWIVLVSIILCNLVIYSTIHSISLFQIILRALHFFVCVLVVPFVIFFDFIGFLIRKFFCNCFYYCCRQIPPSSAKCIDCVLCMWVQWTGLHRGYSLATAWLAHQVTLIIGTSRASPSAKQLVFRYASRRRFITCIFYRRFLLPNRGSRFYIEISSVN